MHIFFQVFLFCVCTQRTTLQDQFSSSIFMWLPGKLSELHHQEASAFTFWAVLLTSYMQILKEKTEGWKQYTLSWRGENRLDSEAKSVPRLAMFYFSVWMMSIRAHITLSLFMSVNLNEFTLYVLLRTSFLSPPPYSHIHIFLQCPGDNQAPLWLHPSISMCLSSVFWLAPFIG